MTATPIEATKLYVGRTSISAVCAHCGGSLYRDATTERQRYGRGQMRTVVTALDPVWRHSNGSPECEPETAA